MIAENSIRISFWLIVVGRTVTVLSSTAHGAVRL